MSYRKDYHFKADNLTSILFFVLILFGIFFVARGVFWLLSLLAPILLIAAAIIDYKVIVNYVKWLVSLVRSNLLLGIGAILLSVIGYPVVFAFLFGKALLNRKVSSIKEQSRINEEGELIDFEEMESRQSKLELPPMPKKEKRTEYDDLFDE